MQIVGIAGDVRDDGPTMDPRPVFYLSFRQHPQAGLRLIARVAGDPSALVPAVRSAVWDVDDQVPLTRVGTMEGWLESSLVSSRSQAVLLATFAGIALLLAGLGLYGTLSYFVNQRSLEMGVRVVLGATPRHLVGSVMVRSASLVGGGLVIGLILGAGVASGMQRMLFGISPLDLLTHLAVFLVLGAIGLLAAGVPALRAVGADPVRAIRAS
jgi:hypothetical protein